MNRRALGGLEVAELGLGCMGMSEHYGPSDDAESLRTIHRALELGITLFDTADVYGRGANEVLLGRAIGDRRERATVATKFGIVRTPDGATAGVNGHPDYVRQACEASLARLGVDVIDLYQQHRVDPDVPIEETVGAMHELVQLGKVRHLGLSEAHAQDIRRAASTAPIACVQSEYSLFTREVERNGVLDTCAELRIGFLAYAPLGRGLLTGRFRESFERAVDDRRREDPRMVGEAFSANLSIVSEVEKVSAGRGAPAGQVALAWLLSRRDFVVPIPGTKRIANLEANAAAADLQLTRGELARLDALPEADGDRHRPDAPWSKRSGPSPRQPSA